jgi:hypothetical protein
MTDLSGFRQWRWADRYLGFSAALAGFVSVDALLQGDLRRSLYWLAGAGLCVLLAPRRLMVLSLILGFVSLQSAFASVVRHDSKGLLITIPTAIAAIGVGSLSLQRHDRWPETPLHFDVVQLSIDVFVYCSILYAAIRLT